MEQSICSSIISTTPIAVFIFIRKMFITTSWRTGALGYRRRRRPRRRYPSEIHNIKQTFASSQCYSMMFHRKLLWVRGVHGCSNLCSSKWWPLYVGRTRPFYVAKCEMQVNIECQRVSRMDGKCSELFPYFACAANDVNFIAHKS